MKAKNRQYIAFTLIESLVAIALFVLVITAALGLFLTYSKAQKETGLRQKIINQITAELEKIAKDIRLNKLSFSGIANYRGATTLYGGSISGKELDLGFTSGIRYFYVPEDGDTDTLYCFGELPSADSGYVYRFTQTECEPLFMISEIKLTDVGFYISPNYNPYKASSADCISGDFNGYYCTCTGDSQCGSGVAPNGLCVEEFCYASQPSVTISITAQIGSDATNVVTLQTTVSSRVYQ